MSKYKLLKTNGKTLKRYETDVNGQSHLVIPSIIIQEGVLNNIYYSQEELSKSPQAWDGSPVVINHPSDEKSANTPTQFNIGRLYNTKIKDNTKVSSEIWINTDRAIKNGFGKILNAFERGEMMELSTGLYMDAVDEKGVFNNKDYEFIAKGMIPDHLALLPNEEGACSISDGCGALRNNCKCEEKHMANNEEKVQPDKVVENKKEPIVKNNKEKHKLIYQLIANSNTQYTDDDMETLMELDSKILKKMRPVIREEQVVVNQLTKEDISYFNFLKANHQKERQKKIEVIVNSEQGFTQKNVSKLDNDGLEELYTFINNSKKSEQDEYVGGVVNNTKKDDDESNSSGYHVNVFDKGGE